MVFGVDEKNDFQKVGVNDTQALQKKLIEYGEQMPPLWCVRYLRCILRTIPREQLYHLIGILQNGQVTLAALLLFGLYPQAYFPQLGVIRPTIPNSPKSRKQTYVSVKR